MARVSHPKYRAATSCSAVRYRNACMHFWLTTVRYGIGDSSSAKLPASALYNTRAAVPARQRFNALQGPSNCP